VNFIGLPLFGSVQQEISWRWAQTAHRRNKESYQKVILVPKPNLARRIRSPDETEAAVNLWVSRIDLSNRTIDLNPGETKNRGGRNVKTTERVYRANAS
jgi:hypothetical protein